MIALISKHRFIISIFLLFIFYGVGVWGIAFGDNPAQFILLTPLNLMITIGIVLANHSNWNSKAVVIFISVAILGFIIEMIGVNTGMLFGEYTYGKTLGWGILNTPFMIGVNWLILVYGTSNFVLTLFSTKNVLFLSIISATIMVSLDYLIEPVAIQLDMWSWADVVIPTQNYIAWWFLAFGLNFMMIKTIIQTQLNNVASVALGIQFLFFILLNILLL
jgi:bisanhydrobacterioruberin hydratase